VIVAVYVLPSTKAFVGLNEAVVPVSYNSVIAVVPCFNVKLVVLIVDGSITILKLAVIVLLSATPVALLLGSVEVTVETTGSSRKFPYVFTW
jgi:hypothetical protein